MTTSHPDRPVPGDGANIQLPPRSQLPAWIIVEDLPGLGTTWYERGVRYWARRAGFVLFFVVLTPLMAFLTWVVVRSVGPPGSARFAIVVTAVAAYTVATFVLTLVYLPRRAMRRGAAKAGPHAGRTGAAVGVAAQAGNALAGAVIFIGAVAGLGFWLAALVLNLFPTLPVERAARRRLAQRLPAGRADTA